MSANCTLRSKQKFCSLGSVVLQRQCFFRFKDKSHRNENVFPFQTQIIQQPKRFYSLRTNYKRIQFFLSKGKSYNNETFLLSKDKS